MGKKWLLKASRDDNRKSHQARTEISRQKHIPDEGGNGAPIQEEGERQFNLFEG